MDESNVIPTENTIIFHITEDQALKLCKHFDKDIEKLEDYEICELLDRVIDAIIIDN